jgi:hypothetical protein
MQGVVMTSLIPNPTLRWALRSDAAVSGAAGAVQLASGAGLAAALGLPAALVWATGLFMPLYAAALLWLARGRPVPSWCVAVVVFGNMAWAAACIAIAAFGIVLPSGLGWAYLLLQAGAVFALALWQYLGWQDALQARPSPSYAQ